MGPSPETVSPLRKSFPFPPPVMTPPQEAVKDAGEEDLVALDLWPVLRIFPK